MTMLMVVIIAVVKKPSSVVPIVDNDNGNCGKHRSQVAVKVCDHGEGNI